MFRKITVIGVVSPIIAIVAALAASTPLLIFSGADPIVAYHSLFVGAFGSLYGITGTLIKTSPLLLTGLGVALGFRCGLANIGAEGQLYMGALLSTWIALTYAQVSPIILLPFIFVVGFLGGALWGFVPGVLKAKLEVNEVIVSFMMNFVAIYLVTFMVLGPLKGPFPMLPQTDYVPTSTWLAPIISNTRIHSGIIVGVVSAFLIYFFMFRTTWGFQIRCTGSQRKASRYAGIDVKQSMILAMMLSGGMAGLAGMCEVLGFQHRLMIGISPGYGFIAIAVALLGRNHPFGVVLTSFLFAGLLVGADEMRRTIGIPVGLVYIIEGLMIFSVLLSEILISRRKQG